MAEAIRFGEWPRLGGLVEAAARDCGWDAGLDHTAALACWMMAEHDAALDHARRAALTDPSDPAHFDLVRRIDTWREGLRGTPFPACVATAHGALTLEPLGHHHAHEFLREYDDEVGRLCCLPRFEAEDDWHRWLDCEGALDDQVTLAVLHETAGFVGSVNLVVSGTTGFFYYWIGARYRGLGLGPAAVAGLLDVAADAWGVETVYAKVYAHNAPSIAGLAKLGFEPLPFRALPPRDDERFFVRGVERPLDVVREDLRGFLAAIRANVVLAEPLRAGAHLAGAGRASR